MQIRQKIIQFVFMERPTHWWFHRVCLCVSLKSLRLSKQGSKNSLLCSKDLSFKGVQLLVSANLLIWHLSTAPEWKIWHLTKRKRESWERRRESKRHDETSLRLQRSKSVRVHARVPVCATQRAWSSHFCVLLSACVCVSVRVSVRADLGSPWEG